MKNHLAQLQILLNNMSVLERVKSGLNIRVVDSPRQPSLRVQQAPESPPVRVIEGGGFAPLKVTETPLQPKFRVTGAPPSPEPKPLLQRVQEGIAEFVAPSPKGIRPQDIVREIPQAIGETGKKVAGLAKDILQGITRSGGSVGLTLARKDELPIDSSSPKWQQKAQEIIFGKEPVKSLSMRIAEGELRIQPYLKKIGAEKAALPVSFVGVALLTGLDFTGAGGEKSVLKVLAKADDVGFIAKTLRQIGVQEDLILPAASKIKIISNEKEIKTALDKISELQKMTRVVETAKPAAAISPKLQPLAQEARKIIDILEKDKVLTLDKISEKLGKPLGLESQTIKEQQIITQALGKQLQKLVDAKILVREEPKGSFARLYKLNPDQATKAAKELPELPKVTREGISATDEVLQARGLPEGRAGEVATPESLTEAARIEREAAKPPLLGDKPLFESISPQTRAKAGIEGEVLGEGKRAKSLNLSYDILGKDAIIVKEADQKILPTKLEPDNFGTYQKFKNFVSDKWTNIREFIQDDWIRVKKLVEREGVKVSDASNPYDKEILFRGKIDTRIERGKDIVKEIDQDIISTAKKAGIEDTKFQDDVNKYLWARHAPERNAKLGDGAAGITTKEANEMVKVIEASPHGKEVIRIANKVSEFNKETLDILLEGGVIDKELHTLLRNTYKNHVPLQRIFEETEAITDVLGGRGFDVRGTGIKRARGSKREVADILSNVTANYEQAVIRAEKNIVDNATLQFARDNAHLGIFEEVKPPQIPVAKVSHREAVDVEFFGKVIKFAESLGADVITKGQPGRRLGFFAPPTKVTRAVATPREVLSHELGHFFDNKFGLKPRFFKRGESKEVAQEMENWMRTIGESNNRIKKTAERFADSFEWWLTNRALAQEDLPLFSKAMEQIIKDIPALKPLLDIRPSGKFAVQQIQELVFRPSVDALLRDPTILSLREAGKPVFLKINDPQLAVALRGINRQKVDGLMRVVQSITRFYSGLATRFNPEFAFPNKIRDLQEAMVYLSSKSEMGVKGAAKILTEERRSYKAIFDFLMGKNTEGAKLYQQMRLDGGTTGGLGLSTRKQVELDIDKIRKLNRSNPRKAAEFFMRRVDDWNTIFEDSTRLSVYRTALAREVSRQRAAVLAKEASVNFNKFGTGGPVINALYMFANASIQGSAKMLMAMKNPKVAGIVIGGVGIAVASTRQWNDRIDSDWRNKVSKWDRLNSLVVVLPSDEGEGIKYVAVPVSWGMKPIKVAMDFAYDLGVRKDVGIGEATESTMTAILEGYNPVGGTDLLSAATPTVLDLPVELGRNKAWHGSRIRPDWDKNAPASIQFFGDLKESPMGRFFISFTDKLSETSDRRIELSPADINYAYEQIIGGAGRAVSKTINTISAVGAGEIPISREVPFASRFYRSIPEERIGASSTAVGDIRHILAEQSRERFNQSQMAEALYQEMKKLPKEEAAEKFDELAKENPNFAKKVSDIFKDENLNLTYTDRLVKQLGVENEERAKYLVSQFNKLDTKEEKGELWDEYVKKAIITKEVARQLIILLNSKKTLEDIFK